MNRLFSAKPILAAAVALGAIGAASAAHASTDVFFSVGIPAYVEPAPVYVQPRPVYVQPRPVYVQPEVTYYDNYRHRYWAERRGWDRDDWRWRDARYAQRGWRDADRDGVPDRYDHAPYNPYRR